MSSISKQEFMRTLRGLLESAKKLGKKELTVVSKDLHNITKPNSYPNGNKHSMPSCCAAMYDIEYKKKVISAPPSGKGATVTIKYFL